MYCKKACLIVDLRDGMNMPKITDMIAVLAAAGWKTDISLKAYSGETMQLAEKAARDDYDVVIGYGGDGTLNEVINGTLNANGKSIVSVIPGGTANEWATESGVPLEPFLAALTLVNSDPRKVDLGYVDVQGLIFPDATQSSQQQQSAGKKARTKKAKKAKKSLDVKHRFLLMAGLGLDAAITVYISKKLKYRIGRLADGLAAVKELPKQRPFPVELRAISDNGDKQLLWQGEAWQVIFGNTRLYGGLIELTPQAYIDDGQLDVCVIMAGNVLTTVEEVASLLFRRQSASSDTKYFKGAHFSIRVPASIGLHLDGGVVELKDYLSKSDRNALMNASNPEQVMVEYRFDAEPAALPIAIPRTYNGTLFTKAPVPLEAPSQTTTSQQNETANQAVLHEPAERVDALLQQGTKVTVVGVGPNPDKRDTYIVAGTTQNQNTGDTRPVAVRVNDNTTIFRRTGEHVASRAVQELQDGAEIVVEGKKSKRGAIRATQMVI